MSRLYCLPFLALGAVSGSAQSTCLLFDGQDDQVTMANTVLNPVATGPFTVEAWVRGVEADQLSHPRILSNRDVLDNGFMFGFHGIWGGSSYKMLCLQLDGLNYILIDNGTYNASLLDGTCHHIAVSKGADSLRFYVDGAHIGSKVLQGDPTAATTAENMIIGNDAPDPQPFKGNISQVRVWDHVRSQAEILADKDYSIPGTTTGLVGYWELNEGTGQNTLDKTESTDGWLGNTGSAEINDPAWGLDACPILGPGRCLVFDGADDQVTMSSSAVNDINTGDFTVEAEISGVEVEQVEHPRILSNRDMIDNGFMFGVHGAWGGSSHKMLCMQLDGLNYLLIDNGSYNGSILDGTCHHVAVTKSADSLRFYVDGMHIGSKWLQGDPSTATSAATMLIGNDMPDPQPFRGNIAQVRLWDEARTQPQIVANMGLSIPGTTPGLVGYWELNDASGQVVVDKTSSADGQLGSALELEAEDPTWVDDCCELPQNVGLTEVDGQLLLTLQPNPVIDLLTIDQVVGARATRILIADALGRTVLETSTGTGVRITLQVGNLAPGSYSATLYDGVALRTARFLKL